MNGENIAQGKINISHSLNHIQFNIASREIFLVNFEVRNFLLSKEDIISAYQQKYVEVLLDRLSIPDEDDLLVGHPFHNQTVDGHKIHWYVNHPEWVDATWGSVVERPEKDELLTFRAEASVYGQNASREFLVKLRAENDDLWFDRDVDSLTNYLSVIMHSGSELPMQLTNGSHVDWFTESQQIRIDHNKIMKLSNNQQEVIDLSARVTRGEREITKTYRITIIDEIDAYLMAYFKGDLGQEKIYFAYSEDGLRWQKLSSELTVDFGSGRLRDPFLGRDKHNHIRLLATEGYDNPSIYIFQSTNLLDFSEKSLLQIAYYDPPIRLTGERAWAPEFVYDIEKDCYFILFSDNGFLDRNQQKAGPIFAVSSADLKHFDYPFPLLNKEYSMIDGTIIQLDGSKYLFFKDEREGAKTIFYAKGNNLDHFYQVNDEHFLHPAKHVEGPMLFPGKNGGVFPLYRQLS